MESINAVGDTLIAELDIQKIVQAVTDTGREVTGASFGAFFHNVTDEKGESYMLYTLSGMPREAFAAFPMPRATELFGPIFRGDGAVRIADVLKDPRYGKMAPHHGMPKGHLPVRSYLAAPVVSRSGKVLGGLFLGIIESMGPNLFFDGFGVPSPNQLKDVIAFTMLVLVLVFRPSGILGERVARSRT